MSVEFELGFFARLNLSLAWLNLIWLGFCLAKFGLTEFSLVFAWLNLNLVWLFCLIKFGLTKFSLAFACLAELRFDLRGVNFRIKNALRA